MSTPHSFVIERTAMVGTMTTEHLRFAPEILKRLGEELAPQVDHCIVELVRNSYDADARLCKVDLVDTDQPGGLIRVSDDGIGMTPEVVRSGWLVLGRSTKAPQSRTPLGRRPVGEKGLGRLAALRLGTKALLVSRPSSRLGFEYRLTIDWNHFDTAGAVEEVPLTIKESRTEKPPGTVIELQGLRDRLTRRNVQQLARALVLLADPFENSHGFHTNLVVPSYADLEERVRQAYFDEASYRLLATIDDKGTAHARVYDQRGDELWNGWGIPTLNLVNRYSTVPATFEFWTFLLGGRRFSNRHATLSEIRKWLEVVGGVHLYHRDLRVHPYGDPGFDWLEMNVARVRSPEERPSTNNSLGRIVTDDANDLLQPKTDRTGFIENEAFNELKRFAQDALEWMAHKRLAASEERRRANRKQTEHDRRVAEEQWRKTVDQLPSSMRSNVQAAASALGQTANRETQSVQEDLQLYRTMASIGIAMTLFAHEADKPVLQIQRMADSLETRTKKLLGLKTYEQALAQPMSVLQQSSRSLSRFAALPKEMIKRDKRRSGIVDVHAVILDMLGLFGAFLSDAKIKPKTEFAETEIQIWGNIAALESILANLLVNAITSFDSPNAVLDDRVIVVKTASHNSHLVLSVLDNGPGIVGISTDDIWLPGRTTVPGGTGMGLTIAKDAATDLGGIVSAVAHGECGGATITVELPILGAKP